MRKRIDWILAMVALSMVAATVLTAPTARWENWPPAVVACLGAVALWRCSK